MKNYKQFKKKIYERETFLICVALHCNGKDVFLTNETAQFLFLAVWDILVSTRGWDKNFILLFP